MISNRHILEERGQIEIQEEVDETGKYKDAASKDGEEMLYSGVVREVPSDQVSVKKTVAPKVGFTKFKRYNELGTVNQDAIKLMY